MIIAVIIAAAGYYIYGPCLLDKMNTPDRNDPDNRLTEKDIDSAKHKLKSKANLNIELTAAEIAAYRAECESDTIPLTNVRFNTSADGITEITCIIDADRLRSLLSEKAVEMEENDILLGILRADRDIPAKINGKFEIKNNNVSIDIQQLEFDRMSIPGFIYKNKMGKIEEYITEIINQKNYNITALTFANDKVHFEGYIP
jgi:hypothetical protein